VGDDPTASEDFEISLCDCPVRVAIRRCETPCRRNPVRGRDVSLCQGRAHVGALEQFRVWSLFHKYCRHASRLE
jgi:hypothetical protein